MIAVRGLHVRFGGVVALEHVDLAVERGTCHGLLGENGAGKSTLGRVLAGIVRPDRGALEIDGVARRFAQPADALAAGVAMVHQELAFCPELSVAENLALGRWPTRGALRVGRVDRAAMAARARELLARIGAAIDVSTPVGRLSTAAEQLVQVAAALGTGADVLVFDEATSSLGGAESERLMALVGELVAGGVTVIWITHRLHEVERLCARVTVLRDGRVAGSLERGRLDADAVVRLMIGRDLAGREPRHARREPGDVRLDVSGLLVPGAPGPVSLAVRAGEVVGLAGLMGAGRSELLRAVFGLDRAAGGRVTVGGRVLGGRAGRWSARDAMDAGLALLPEDRKRQGLVMGLDGTANVTLASLARFRRGARLDRGRERRAAQEAFGRLGVRAPSTETPVSALSGGNQQKVALAKWLVRAPSVLLADEPTRGVDVGAKAQIHALLDELAFGGAAVLVASSDLPELLALSRRVLVMRGGRLVGELDRARADEEAVMRLMAGVGSAA